MSDDKDFLVVLIDLVLLSTSRFNVALSNCYIGDSCVIHNGVCIGQDGKVGFQSLLVSFLFYIEDTWCFSNGIDLTI